MYRATVYYEDGKISGNVFSTAQLACTWILQQIADADDFRRATITALKQ